MVSGLSVLLDDYIVEVILDNNLDFGLKTNSIQINNNPLITSNIINNYTFRIINLFRFYNTSLNSTVSFSIFNITNPSLNIVNSNYTFNIYDSFLNLIYRT